MNVLFHNLALTENQTKIEWLSYLSNDWVMAQCLYHTYRSRLQNVVFRSGRKRKKKQHGKVWFLDYCNKKFWWKIETRTNAKFYFLLKFIYSEKATKFCKLFTLLLSYVVPVKSKVKISQNLMAFSEYINFSWNGGSSVRKEKNHLDYLVCIVYFIKVGDKIKDFY